jgi:hypothetical protein
MKAVAFTQVTFTDTFWAPRQVINREVTLPSQHEVMRRSGRVGAWNWAMKPNEANPPHRFWDSDVGKWVEAASYSLAVHYDAILDAQIDAIANHIRRAQLPDGYFNSHYQNIRPHMRWSNLRDDHELYCAGHLIEAAVAHNAATGKRTLLDAMLRYTEHIYTKFGRGKGQLRGYCGHPEIELALIRLGHHVGEPRYLELAQFFVDERGQKPHFYDYEARRRGHDPKDFWAKTYEYLQAHKPVREQTEVTGHAVRGVYLYSAMADLALMNNDDELLKTSQTLWAHLTNKRMYLTAGIGTSSHNEGYTSDFDLPDETAYAETCAAIGLIFWAQRMFNLTKDGLYTDMIEKALYNGFLSGVSLDGTEYFYENPLASRGNHHRQAWFECACCPPNVARLLASLSGYVYSTSANGIWVHLYVGNEATNLKLDDVAVSLTQTTQYPWDGIIQIGVKPDHPAEFDLHFRIPSWCENAKILVNDVPLEDIWGRINQGYVAIHRNWQSNDFVTLKLDMPVQMVYANPLARHMLGRAALQRGPVIYCFEQVDQAFIGEAKSAFKTNAPLMLDRISLSKGSFVPQHQPNLLNGVTSLHGNGHFADDHDWKRSLYRTSAPAKRKIELTAIPYFAWDNREPGEMRVWMRI